jgi:predicted CoA-binding protein
VGPWQKVKAMLPAKVLELLRRDPHDVRVALVGASEARHKYGNIILRDLLRKGYSVLPVNPSLAEVEGLPCYPDLAAVPGPIHIVDFVVPPAVATAVTAALPTGAAEVLWYQPGAFERATVAAAQGRGAEVVAGPCIMVET